MCPTEGAKISQVQSTDGQKNRVYMNEAAINITELKTALYSFHVEQGGKMVPFAGYQMPVQYPEGIVKEHQHVRNAAGIFDVSHMGQFSIYGTESDYLPLEKIVHHPMKLWKF